LSYVRVVNVNEGSRKLVWEKLKNFLCFGMNDANLWGCTIYSTDSVNAGTLRNSKYNSYVISNYWSLYTYEQGLGNMSTMIMKM
jgi:hypothetical protein